VYKIRQQLNLHTQNASSELLAYSNKVQCHESLLREWR